MSLIMSSLVGLEACHVLDGMCNDKSHMCMCQRSHTLSYNSLDDSSNSLYWLFKYRFFVFVFLKKVILLLLDTHTIILV